jgi:hypothetical protein
VILGASAVAAIAGAAMNITRASKPYITLPALMLPPLSETFHLLFSLTYLGTRKSESFFTDEVAENTEKLFTTNDTNKSRMARINEGFRLS